MKTPVLRVFSISACVLLLHFSSIAHSQTLDAKLIQPVVGDWSGSIELPTAELGITLHITSKQDTALAGTIDIPEQNLMGQKLMRFQRTADSLHCQITMVPGKPTFHGRLSTDGATLSGTFTQSGSALPFSLHREGSQTGAAASGSSSTTASSDSVILDSLRAYYTRALKEWNVPGMAVAIVKDGKVLMAEGFGTRDVEHNLPVTGQTLFAIGSSTKAFTSALMASLVAEGKVDWNKPVRSYLPTFKLKDPYATEQLTVRDLLTHVSGLPRHDMLWYASHLTRQEIFDRLQYLEPNAALHEKWQYQNMMFMTAGILEEHITGKSWETLVRERIFNPLGMTSTNTSIDTMEHSGDYARGYEAEHEKKSAKGMADAIAVGAKPATTFVQLPFYREPAVGPAGTINSNAVDMAKWLQLNLNGGMFQGQEVIDPAQLKVVHTPQVVMGDHAGAPEIVFDLYAMGWMCHAFRGEKLLEHGGNINGFSAEVAFLPKKKIGVVILTNMNGTPMTNLMMYETFDRLAFKTSKDWSKYVQDKMAVADSNAKVKDDVSKKDADRVLNTTPSHPLSAYTGEFENPAYGLVKVSLVNNKLQAVYGDSVSRLVHYHYDVFTLRDLTSDEEDGMKVQFQTDLAGDITRVLMPLEPSVDPIVFTRRASSELQSHAYLEKFVGQYEIGPQLVSIAFAGEHLVLRAPGQPDWTMDPVKENTFQLKELKGFTVKFNLSGGKVVSMVSIQPNGSFEGKRK